MSKKSVTRKSKKAAARQAAIEAHAVEGFGEELGLRDVGTHIYEDTGTEKAVQRQSRRSSRVNHGCLAHEDFLMCRYSCGVFKVQKEYDILVKEAHTNGRSIENEMKAQGFKDYNAFARSCERFGLLCWPSELAELGSGFVLYFNSLSFLASLLVVVILVQVPAMAYNQSYDSLDQWWWHEWKGAWFSNRDCECFGKNEGIYGPSSAFQNTSYGTSCQAWDAAWCRDPAQPYSHLGRWCCVSWCFAPQSCSSSLDSDSPSMSNRHYRGMVRSVTSCPQSDIAIAQCADLSDVAFAEAGVEKPPTGYFIPNGWSTPGNLGPDTGDKSHIMLLYAFCAPLFHVLIAFARNLQNATEEQVDASTTVPSDFAVMVKGLPSTATDEKSIEDFFRQHAVKGKTDTEIVKVVIGWHHHFSGKMKEIQSLRDNLESMRDRYSEQAQAIQGRIKQISDEIAKQAGSDSMALKSTGVAVVVLRHQRDQRALLERWTSAWARHFYAEAEDVDWLPPNNGLKRGQALPRFRTADGEEWLQNLRVERAPDPGDINWMRLGVSRKERLQKLAITTIMMVVTIVVSFFITWGLNELQNHVQEENADKGDVERFGSRLLSILIGTGVSLINVMIRVFARYFGEEEFHDTHTDKEFSQALKMSVGMIINTSGIIFWLNAQPKNWYAEGGLVEDVFYVLIMDGVVAQFWMFLDIVYIMNYFERRKVDQKQLALWNSTIGHHYPPRCEEDKQALQAVRIEISKLKKAFEPDECDNPHRYASALNSFMCCIIYMPVCPLLPFVGLLGMLCQYWIDKLLLLRWQKRPRPQNANTARWCWKFLKTIAPVCIPCSVFVFVTPSWKDKASCYFWFTVTITVAIVMNFIPLAVWRVIFCRKSRRDGFTIQDDDFEDYYNAQYMWPKQMKYHKDQFLYQYLPDEKNPEMLEVGQDRTLTLHDMQGTYGTAMQNAAVLVAYGNYSQRPMRGVGVAGYSDCGWGGAWFYSMPATYGPPMYGSPGGDMQRTHTANMPPGVYSAPSFYPAPYAAPGFGASPVYATPAVGATSVYSGYDPSQPSVARYGAPADPRPWGQVPPGAPTYNSWGTPAATAQGSPPHAFSAPANLGGMPSPGSYGPLNTPPLSYSSQGPQFNAPASSWGTHPPGSQSQVGASPPTWGTGAVRPPAQFPAGGFWGAGAQPQAPAYQWPARERV